MSRTQHGPMDQVMLRMTCSECGVRTDEWCRSKTGRYSNLLHSARYYAWTRDGRPGPVNA